MWPWLVGAAVIWGIKKIIESNEDDRPSPPPPPPSPGPSREELKRRRGDDICQRAVNDATKFILTHDDHLIFIPYMDGSQSVETLKKAYEHFLKSYSAIQDRPRIDHDSAACLTESLTTFGLKAYLHPSESRRDLSFRHDILQLVQLENGLALSLNDLAITTETEIEEDVEWKNVPETLQEYANDDATPAEVKKLVSLWQKLNENTAKDEAPRIVVCGLLKAGKSSLLNMLIGDFSDDPCFRVDVVRATVAEQTRPHDGFIYVDTPGLDAELEDEEEAWQSFLKADCFIFVHSLKGGELVQQELDFLGSLREERRKTAENMLVVLTYAEVCDEEKLGHLKQTIGDKLEHILGRRPWMTAVSNTRYKKGRREDKPRLAETSGLPFLQSHINSLRDLLAASAPLNRVAEINELRKKIGALLEADLADTEQRLESLTISDERAYAAMLREYKDICTNWKEAVKAYEDM